MWIFGNELLHSQTVSNGPPSAKFVPLAQTSSYATAYKIQILQLQTDANKVERRAFGQTISKRIENHPDFLDLIFFSN